MKPLLTVSPAGGEEELNETAGSHPFTRSGQQDIADEITAQDAGLSTGAGTSAQQNDTEDRVRQKPRGSYGSSISTVLLTVGKPMEAEVSGISEGGRAKPPGRIVWRHWIRLIRYMGPVHPAHRRKVPWWRRLGRNRSVTSNCQCFFKYG